jgi:hypothetical protein
VTRDRIERYIERAPGENRTSVIFAMSTEVTMYIQVVVFRVVKIGYSTDSSPEEDGSALQYIEISTWSHKESWMVGYKNDT